MKVIFLLLFTFYSCICFSQSDLKLTKQQTDEFQTYFLQKFIKNYRGRLDTLGIMGFTYAKFKIDNFKSFQEISVIKGTHYELTNWIKEILYNADSLLSKIERNTWVIVPFSFSLEKNGRAEKVSLSEDYVIQFFSLPKSQKITDKFIFLPVINLETPCDDNNTWGRMKLYR